MSKEIELLDKLDKALSLFTKIQVGVNFAPVIGRVVESMAEAIVYLREKILQESPPVADLPQESETKELESGEVQ